VSKPRDLAGSRVLITGASSGVGAAAAVAFARAGADVALLARNAEGLERVAFRVRQHGRRALVVAADVADQAAVDAAVARVAAEWGGLDVAVSNAAAMAFGPFQKISKADFDRTVAVTFTGAVDFVRAVLPELERSAGTLVVTGSINGLAPLPAFSPYSASKHALRGFVRSLRVELKAQRSKVRVSLVNPGAIDTPVWRALTTATGRLPRTPPEGYTAEVIADALVAMARSPRREISVGLEGLLFSWLWRTPPVDDLVMGLVYRYYLSGRTPAVADPLNEPQGDGRTDGPLIGRRSLWAPIRTRIPWPPR
jgi:NAD(P)-dependent dehydrogenase (short-subunit alcohol dehydrogenase family)